MKIKLMLIAMLMTICPMASAFVTQSELNEFASNTKLYFAVVSNLDADSKFSGQLTISNNSKVSLPPEPENGKYICTPFESSKNLKYLA